MSLQHHIIQHRQVIPNQQQRAGRLLHLGSKRNDYVMSDAQWRQDGATDRCFRQDERVSFLVQEGKGGCGVAEVYVVNVFVMEFREHVDDGVWLLVVMEQNWLYCHGVVGGIGDLQDLQLFGEGKEHIFTYRCLTTIFTN